MNGRDLGLMSAAARDKLESLTTGLSTGHLALLERMERAVAAKIPRTAIIDDFVHPATLVEGIFRTATTALNADQRERVKRALIARLALNLPSAIGGLDLPDSILAVYPATFTRLANFLTEPPSDEAYDDSGEYFRKDVRFVLGLSVPCGARVIDLTSRVPLYTVAYSMWRAKDPTLLVRYLQARGTGRWFRHHVDSRHVSEFNEQGLEAFYLRVADLLRRREYIRGLTGTSWYYDPHVVTISPRLAYLHRLPERGAFLLPHGTNPSAVRNATKTSETRRRLYQEGKYTPVSFSMLWPREALLNWAARPGADSGHVAR